MKKILTMALCLSVVFLMNCGSSSDDDGTDYLAALVGSWTLTNQAVTGDCTGAGNNACTSDCPVLTINANGSYTFDFGGGDSESGTVTVTATTITICETGSDDCGPLPYVVAGNSISVTDNDPGDADFAGCTVVYTLTKN